MQRRSDRRVPRSGEILLAFAQQNIELGYALAPRHLAALAEGYHAMRTGEAAGMPLAESLIPLVRAILHVMAERDANVLPAVPGGDTVG